MLTAFILTADGMVSRQTTEQALAAAVRDPQTTFWLDMCQPSDEEIALLDDVFGFHPLAIEDTIGYSQRPKIESYNHIGDACKSGYFYMVFHAPDLETFRQKLRTKELDLFVSDRYLVTIRDERIRSVDEVLQDALDDLEERALLRPEPSVLTSISVKKRELLNLRRIVAPQREVVAQLTRGDVPFIREGTRVFMRDVQDHLIRIVEMVELYRDLVVGARDIYLSSISNRLNEIMKTLTMITVFAIPLTVGTGFFGMNFAEEVPVFNEMLHSQAGFWIATLMTTGIIGLIFYWFYRKGWLHRAEQINELPEDWTRAGRRPDEGEKKEP